MERPILRLYELVVRKLVVRKKVVVVACCIFFLVPAWASISDRNDKIVVISHPSIEDTVYQRRTLRAIFGMRLNAWPDGKKVSVYVLETTDERHLQFCRDILKMLPYRLQKNWDRLMYSGTGVAPTYVKSLEEMKRLVAATPGALGYLTENSIDPTVVALEVK